MDARPTQDRVANRPMKNGIVLYSETKISFLYWVEMGCTLPRMVELKISL